MIDVRSGRELFADADYESDVYGLAFAPDGALITSSDDGQLRRYGPDLKLTVKRAAPDGKSPTASRSTLPGGGSRSAMSDQPPVSILDAKTLAPLAKAQTGDLSDGNLAERRLVSRRRDTCRGRGRRRRNQGEWRQFPAPI